MTRKKMKIGKMILHQTAAVIQMLRMMLKTKRTVTLPNLRVVVLLMMLATSQIRTMGVIYNACSKFC